MKKALSIIILTIILCLCSVVNAKEIIGEGVYMLKDGETISECETKALLNASNNASEQTKVFIRTYIKTSNLSLTEENIIQINSYALKIIKATYNWEFNNAKMVICHAEFDFDEDLDKYITTIKNNNHLKQENNHLKQENNYLKQNYTLTYRTRNHNAIKAFEEGKLKMEDDDPVGASKKFKEAIDYDDKDVVIQEAYFESLLASLETVQCQKAINSFITVQKDYYNNANSFYYYGLSILLDVINNEYAYDVKQKAQKSVDYFLKALEYNCDKKDIYAKLAIAYTYLQDDNIYSAKSFLKYSVLYKGQWFKFALGRIYEQENNNIKALQCYEQAIRENYYFIEAWYACSYVSAKMKEKASAQEYMNIGYSLGQNRGKYKHHNYFRFCQKYNIWY